MRQVQRESGTGNMDVGIEERIKRVIEEAVEGGKGERNEREIEGKIKDI